MHTRASKCDDKPPHGRSAVLVRAKTDRARLVDRRRQDESLLRRRERVDVQALEEPRAPVERKLVMTGDGERGVLRCEQGQSFR